jgi:hypothetical protein
MSKRAAWVVTWSWLGETRKPDRFVLHILQPRWKVQKVVDYMKSLYLNSEFFPVSERFDFFSPKAWHGLVRVERFRILVGTDPHLFASKVSDLRTEPRRAVVRRSSAGPSRQVLHGRQRGSVSITAGQLKESSGLALTATSLRIRRSQAALRRRERS